MASNLKRKYNSGAFKRAEKNRRIEAATSSTRNISSFLQTEKKDELTICQGDTRLQGDCPASSSDSDGNEDYGKQNPEISENNRRSKEKEAAEKEESIAPFNIENIVTAPVLENGVAISHSSDPSSRLNSVSERSQFDFDSSRRYPADRGHFCETINDASLKMEILNHGPCRPFKSFIGITESIFN